MRKCLAIVIVGVSALTPPAHAQERFTDPFGGDGGQQFVLRCPAGTEVTGVSALVGAYVNNIGPICNGRPMPGAGGRGNPRSASCPNGSIVDQIDAIALRSPNRLLKALGLRCVARGTRQRTAAVPLDTPGAYTTTSFKQFAFTPGYPTGSMNCAGQSIIGLQGRAGAAVDALGLICGKAGR